MIFEYPEEFVVPVIYTDELKENPMYREWELKYLQMEKVVEPYEKMKEYEMFSKDEYEEELVYNEKSGKKGIDFLKLNEEKSYEELDEDCNCYECVKDEHGKKILNEIDNEYAKSETLCV